MDCNVLCSVLVESIEIEGSGSVSYKVATDADGDPTLRLQESLAFLDLVL